MRLRLLIPLIELRQRLFWANARSRNAKIALASGLLLVGWIALMLAMGGGGIGAAAARFARPILIADLAFGMVFVFAVGGALVFGLGSPAALSYESPRRYPLSRLERLVARCAVEPFDPLWLFVFDFGIAAGFAATGASHWWGASRSSPALPDQLSGREVVMRLAGPFLALLPWNWREIAGTKGICGRGMMKSSVRVMHALILCLPLAFGASTVLAAQQTPAQAKPARQQAPSAKRIEIPVGTQFMRDRSFFPISVSPYLPWRIPKPVLVNSPTLEQMIHNGKLELSLGDAIRLAIENNLQVDMQRYATWIADTNVLAARGMPNAAGASLDPQVTSYLYWQQSASQNYNPFLSGTGTSVASSTTSKNEWANFSYERGFLSGTSFRLDFNNQRYASSSPGNFINPILSGTLGFTITQPLLSGFGFLPNEYNIIEARNSSQIARYDLENQATTVITLVEDDYWQLVADIGNVQAIQANVDAAEKNLKDTQEEVRIGTVAHLEVITAQSSLKRFQQQLIEAQATERIDEITLLNLIVRNQTAAGLEHVRIVPTENINTPPKIDIIPYRQALEEALRQRPDFLAQELTLKNNGISARANRNLMLPSLSLQAVYQSTGLAGPSSFVTETPTGIAANTSGPIVDANGNPVLINGQPVYPSTPTFTTQVQQVQAGLLDSWNTLWHQSYPVYSLSLKLALPLHNRVAQAAEANALLAKRKQEENVQWLKNQIAMQVHEAQIQVSTGQVDVRAAVESTQLAKEQLANARELYRLGRGSQFELTQDQANVATAQSVEIRAKVLLLKAVDRLNAVLGRTLQVHNISISDARTGHVLRAPLIPGTPILERDP